MGQIGFDKVEMARASNLKFKRTEIGPNGGPEYLPFNSKLPQDLTRLPEVTLHLRTEGRDFALVIRLVAIIPGFSEGPRRVVQEQSAEGKKP